jgi:UDP-N-acetylmuramate dehydrogenase
MIEQRDVPLAPLTSLRLGGSAKRVVRVEEEADLVPALASAEASGEAVLVLGGGSNLVVADEGWGGLVLRVALRGVSMTRLAPGSRATETVRVEVLAGEPWDPFVERCVGEGYSGIECLSGIPGLVGATPIQNVGAYGQEVSETIVAVRAFDREARVFVDLAPEACRFGYRTSLFRHNPRYVVVSVVFELAVTNASAPLRYAELVRGLGVREGDAAPLADVRRMVLALRRTKGMVLDPGDPDSVSAGSFFVNPTLSSGELAALESRVADARVLRAGEVMPRFAAGLGRWKVSAGWLVERAGFTKGYGAGSVGVSSKHALALVHRGQGTTRELVALARQIRDGVRGRFGVELAPEPVFVGCAL